MASKARWLLVSMMGVAGCGPELKDYCEQQRFEACALGQRCGYYESAAICREQRLAEPDLCGAHVDAVVNKTQRYDAAAAGRCLAAARASCDMKVLDCPGVFTGLREAGSECLDHGDCVPDSYCDAPDGCPGHCVRYGVEGELVGRFQRCGSGLFPNWEQVPAPSGVGTWSQPVCRPYLSGVPCTAGACGPELACHALCDGGVCGFPGVCGAPLHEGEYCSYYDVCEAPLVCGDSSHCQRYGARDSFSVPCKFDLRYDYQLGCVPLVGESKMSNEEYPCLWNGDCVPPLVCQFGDAGDGRFSRCARPLGEFAPCDAASQCARALECNQALPDGGVARQCLKRPTHSCEGAR